MILKKVELPVVPNSECQAKLRESRLGKHFILDPSFICAGNLNIQLLINSTSKKKHNNINCLIHFIPEGGERGKDTVI